MRSTPEHRKRRRNALIVGSACVVALAAWIGVAFALGTGSGEEQGSGSGDGSGATVPQEETTAPTEVEPTTTDEDESGEGSGEDTERQASGGSGDDGGKGASGEESGEEEDAGSSSEAGSSESSEEGNQGDADVAPPDPGGDGSSGKDSSGGDSGEQEQGEAQEGMNPLGRDVEPGDLTQTDKERVRSAGGRFVAATFGYTGDSTDDYVNEISNAAQMRGIYNSPAGEVVTGYEDEIEDGGIQSAAVVDHFEITKTVPNQVEGRAYFRIGGEYGENFQDIEGQYIPFYQDMTLCPVSETYEVCYAEVHREFTDDYTYYEPDSGGQGSEGSQGAKGADGGGKGGDDR